ncbi:MAG: hypothetical protein QOG30_6, partial [Acidimicrobiaceae bacterium]
MAIGLLGSVQVTGTDGTAVLLGGPKERAVLAVLALSANHPVSETRLIDALWGDDPPRTAARTLQSHVSRIRQALASGVVIESAPAGWVLRTEPGTIDVERFESLLAAGRTSVDAGDHLGAALTFADALRLWRGNALEEFVNQPWARADAARLEELRILAVEERIDAELACGRHHEVIGDVEAACRAHPLRERLWGQRMLALYRAGRQAESLRSYQQLRRTLGEELGIEPNPALARLEQAVLTQSPALDWRPPRHTTQASGVTPADGIAPASASSVTIVTFLCAQLSGPFEDLNLRDAVLQSEGAALSATGNELVAVFRLAIDAATCAVSMQQIVARQQRRTQEGPPLLKIGLHTGEPPDDASPVESVPVLIAKGLCSSAAPSEIIASRLVADWLVAHGAIEINDLGLVDIEGVGEPVAACVVGWTEQSRRPLPVALSGLTETAFVGRDLELAQLDDVWQQTRQHGRRVALIAGEPGIGKTTLAVKVAADAWKQGAVVLFGRCDEESIVPFQPFVEAVTQYLESTPPEILRRQLGDQAGDLALLVPGVTRRLPELADSGRHTSDTDRYRLLEAVCALFEAVAAEAPLLLVLDDLHWADRPTLQLLTHVIRNVTTVPLLVLGTYRDTDLVRTHPMAEALVELRRADLVERVLLRGLDADDVIQMVSGGLNPIPDDITLGTALWQETEGNPLFLREILRHLEESGMIARRDDGRWLATRRVQQLGIPEGVKEVIGRRLSRLSEAANIALRTGSVLGRELRLDVLEDVTELGTDALLDALDEATAAGVIAESRHGIGRWSFTHALVRDSLYEELSLTRRVRMHQRVGEALERLAPTTAGPHLAELGFHFAQAAVAGGATKAVDYLRRAGEHATTMAGHEEAARHYATALEVADDAGLDRATRSDLLRAQAEAEMTAGAVGPARATLERAISLIGAEDPERLARAALGFGGTGVRLWWADIGSHNPRLIALLESALEALPLDDSVLRARVLGSLAQELHWKPGEQERRASLSAEAVAMARRLGDPTTLGLVLMARMLAVWSPQTLEDDVQRAAEVRAIGEAIDNPRMAVSATLLQAMKALDRGDLIQATRFIEQSHEGFAKMRDPVGVFTMTGMRAGHATAEGRFAEAADLFRESFEAGQAAAEPNAFTIYGCGMGLLRMLQGRSAEITNAIADAGRLFPDVNGLFVCLLGAGLAESGNADAAAKLTDGFDPTDPEALPPDALWLGSLHSLSRVYFWQRDRDGAAVLYDLLLPFERYVASIGWFPVGSVQFGLALCAAACGRHGDAERHFGTATDLHRGWGWHAFLVDTLRYHAAMLDDVADPADQPRLMIMLEEIMDEGRRIGMAGHVEEAQLRRARLLGEPLDPPLRSVSRRARAKAKLTQFGRSRVSSWTRGRTDEELSTRFGSTRSQRTFFGAMTKAFQPAMAFGFEGDIMVVLRPLVDDGDPEGSD